MELCNINYEDIRGSYVVDRHNNFYKIFVLRIDEDNINYRYLILGFVPIDEDISIEIEIPLKNIFRLKYRFDVECLELPPKYKLIKSSKVAGLLYGRN